mgnify:CR=1 FL=1
MPKKKKKKPRKRKPKKGFTRSRKEWEESLATHIGKVIDNLDGDQILKLVEYSIAAYAGHQAASNLGVPFPQSLGGSATAIIGLKLATAMNPIAGAAGVISLAGVGLCAVPQVASAMIEGAETVKESAEHAAEMLKEHPEQATAIAMLSPLFGVSGVAWGYGRMMGWW